jgi:hypothetical protein
VAASRGATPAGPPAPASETGAGLVTAALRAPALAPSPESPGGAVAGRVPAPGAAMPLERAAEPAGLPAPSFEAPAGAPATALPRPEVAPSPEPPGDAAAGTAPAPAGPMRLARGPDPAGLPAPDPELPAERPEAALAEPEIVPSPALPDAAVDRAARPAAAAAPAHAAEPGGLPAPTPEPAPTRPAAGTQVAALPPLRPAPRPRAEPAPVPADVAGAAVALPEHVYLHYPASAQAEADRAAELLRAAGIPSVQSVPVRLDISRSNVRYFHAGDAEAAAGVASILAPALPGDPPEARDFTDFPTPSASGKLEIWLAGTSPGGGQSAAPRQAPAAPRVVASDPAQAEAIARMVVQRAVERMLDERARRR